MSEIQPLGIIEYMLGFYNSVSTAMKEAFAEEAYCNEEYQDLTHALEFTEFGTVAGYKLAKQVKDNRQKRRQAKELQEQLDPLNALMKRYANFFNELKNVHAEIERTIGVQVKRTYRRRVRGDLFEKPMKAGKENERQKQD